MVPIFYSFRLTVFQLFMISNRLLLLFAIVWYCVNARTEVLLFEDVTTLVATMGKISVLEQPSRLDCV